MNIEKAGKSADVGLSSSTYQPRLLLVDDERSVLTSLAALLRFARPNYTIGVASSAEEALRILEDSEVDLIVTDLKLPAMSGLSLVKAALTRHPETRSILMTAYGTESIDFGAYCSGCVCYLEKPFDVERLLLSVDETLHEKQMREAMSGARLAEAVASAASKKSAQSIRVDTGTNRGLLIVEKQEISYADFGRLVGINALIAMLGCQPATIYMEEGLSELKNADLPVAAAAFVEAAKLRTTREQLTKLRESGRMLGLTPSHEYPERDFEEAIVQERMLSEILQRLRELQLEAGSAGTMKRKRLPFHQVLHGAALTKQVQLRNLVNAGIDHYTLQNYDEARRLWKEALAVDPHCQQAKRNLQFLNRISGH